MAKYKLVNIPPSYKTNPMFEGMFTDNMVVDGEFMKDLNGKDIVRFRLQRPDGKVGTFNFSPSMVEEVIGEEVEGVKEGMSKNTKYIAYGAAALLIFLFVVKPLFAKSE